MLLAASPLLYLGLGLFLISVCFGIARPGAVAFDWRPSFFLGFAAAYAAGLSLSYLLVLCLPLPQAMLVGASLAVLGWLLLFFRRLPYLRPPVSKGAATFFLLLLFVYGVKILAEPVRDWDARSIWFFQGKIIFYEKAVSLDWANPYYRFANLDYPKLLPALAAQSAYLLGYWNEYLPKMGVLHLLVPLAAALAHLSARTWSFAFYFLLAMLMPGSWMWNGYVDGYLALYAGLGALFLWRAGEGRRAEILPAAVFLLLLTQMKKEGVLVLGSVMLAWVIYRGRWRDLPHKLPSHFWRALVFGLALLLPFFVWELKKRGLGLTNQLLGDSPSFADAWRKITQESAIQNITYSILVEGKVWALLALAAVMAAWGWVAKVRAPREWLFVLLFPLFFLPNIYAVLIISPLDQHLISSMRVNMNRVPLTILQIGFAFLFLYAQRLLREEDSA